MPDFAALTSGMADDFPLLSPPPAGAMASAASAASSAPSPGSGFDDLDDLSDLDAVLRAALGVRAGGACGPARCGA